MNFLHKLTDISEDSNSHAEREMSIHERDKSRVRIFFNVTMSHPCHKRYIIYGNIAMLFFFSINDNIAMLCVINFLD